MAAATALPLAFFSRPTLTVARELLGKRLCHRLPGGQLRAGTIVEVEAYLGLADKASHARLQRRGGAMVPTARTAAMFGTPGRAYVYFVYGMHTCFNVVAHEPEAVGAVLIRALAPEEPLRLGSCSGPARLCVALGIERSHYGCVLTDEAPIAGSDAAEDRLWIAPSTMATIADDQIVAGPRIGVDYAGADAKLPYRLCIRNNPHLSKPAG